MNVVLCICTCKRPVGLTRLLEAVAELDVERQLSVVVIDNDASAAAGLEVCQRLAASYRWPLVCAVEERRGISFARNRAVTIALEQDPDFIAMLDDDERPCREWLRELLRVQAETGADVVGGPAFRDFPQAAPTWMTEGGLFKRGQRPDGTEVRLYGANNFIARSSCFRALSPEPFDPAFALSGGEDSVFFRHLERRNYGMGWAAGAHVYETVPMSRTTLGWLMQYRFKNGINKIRIERLFDPGTKSELRRIKTTVNLFAMGFIQCLAHGTDRVGRVRGTLMMCNALGRVAGHCGMRYAMYRKIHGT